MSLSDWQESTMLISSHKLDSLGKRDPQLRSSLHQTVCRSICRRILLTAHWCGRAQPTVVHYLGSRPGLYEMIPGCEQAAFLEEWSLPLLPEFLCDSPQWWIVAQKDKMYFPPLDQNKADSNSPVPALQCSTRIKDLSYGSLMCLVTVSRCFCNGLVSDLET